MYFLWACYLTREWSTHSQCSALKKETKIPGRVHFTHIFYQPNSVCAYNTTATTAKTNLQIIRVKDANNLLNPKPNCLETIAHFKQMWNPGFSIPLSIFYLNRIGSITGWTWLVTSLEVKRASGVFESCLLVNIDVNCKWGFLDSLGFVLKWKAGDSLQGLPLRLSILQVALGGISGGLKGLFLSPAFVIFSLQCDFPLTFHSLWMAAIGHFDQNCVVYNNSGRNKLVLFPTLCQVHILSMGPQNYWNLDIFSFSEMSEIG